MSEKPIIFSTEMVRAILEGRKTQTRRVVKQHIVDRFILDDNGNLLGSYTAGIPEAYPSVDDAPYQPGDILWVRESWCEKRGKYFYKADNICNGCTEDGICLPEGVAKHITCALCEDRDGYIKWRPSIHMPREAARIFLRVKNVRVERLQEITPVEVVAEGMGAHECRECIATYGNPCCQDEESECGLGDEILGDFRELWDSLNAKRGYGWDTNPWVWVIEFERVEGHG